MSGDCPQKCYWAETDHGSEAGGPPPKLPHSGCVRDLSADAVRPLEAASRPTGHMAVAQQNAVELISDICQTNHLDYSGSDGTPGKPQLHVPQLVECLTKHAGIPGFSPNTL